jgi:allantoate deiminase
MTPDTTTTSGLDNLAAAVLTRCAILAVESERPDRLTRTFLSAPMHRVHEHLSGWMVEAGMEVCRDPAANLIGRLPAADGDIEAPVLMIGSHLDTVPDAGKYDGVLGVLLGVAAAEALRGRRLPFALEVVGFSEEEGVRYRTSYLGSLALCGQLDPALLDRVDDDGITMADAYRGFGLDPGAIARAAYPPGRVVAYLEAHIEQGPVLESWGLPVGLVTAIAGQTRLWVNFQGRAAHAGTTPMDLRRDPLPAAAELVLETERLARAVEGLRGTVGTIAASPGAVNVVPGAVRLSLDIRHAEDDVRERAVAMLLASGEEIAARRGLVFRVDQAQHRASVPVDAHLADLLASAVASAGFTPRHLVSGAGHDAVVMASLAPIAMLFLRSPGGISHHPDESVLPGDVRIALDVIIRFADALAAAERSQGGR